MISINPEIDLDIYFHKHKTFTKSNKRTRKKK